MKTYQIESLKARIAKQEGIIEVIKGGMKRANMPAWKKAEYQTRLAKEIRVLNYMIATLERAN
jgi:hypothetical protein